MAYKKLKLWFDKDLALLIGNKILEVYPEFDHSTFSENVDEKTSELELKDRVEAIADELWILLGCDYKSGISILLQILGAENKKESGMFKEYYWIMPIAKFVEKFGMEHFELSIQAIEEITKRNTGEYTIRPFIEKYPEKTLSVMKKWSKSENKHVRRLSSEGGRPRLPWAGKLDMFIQDPSPLFPILDNLKDDPSKYVRKSVANCINDIFKDNYEKGKALIELWNEPNISKQRRWIIKHALRNVLKAGNEWAVKMVG